MMRKIPHLSWAEVCARRLDRHMLTTPASAATPAGVVRAMCGAHAQIISAAELSIGLRMTGADRMEIRTALWEQRSLIKTYGPRGTVHLLPTQDLPMWTGALSALPNSQATHIWNDLLTSEQAEAIIQAIALILEGTELTTDELTKALVDHLGSWTGDPVMPAFQEMWPRWRIVQGTAALRGALCFGPNRGRKVTYTNPRSWMPGFQPMDGQMAVAELVKRYLYAYGPATPGQFAQWLATSQRWAFELFDSLAAELQQVDLAGIPAWVVAGDLEAPSLPSHSLHLLPYFDAYMVGCHPREQVFPGQAAERALVRGQAGNYPVLLVDGIVAGVWSLRRSGRKLDITVEPLKKLTAGQSRRLDAQVQRIGEILEGNPQLTIGAVTTGGHA